jgi:hypothetical protein
MNLLIPHVHLYNHPDPLFDEFTYGDSGARARKLKKLNKGDYVFFHKSVGGKKYITAYYVSDRVLDTVEASKDKNIIAKYRNPHIIDCLSGRTYEDDNAVLFGDPITSKILARLLIFDKSLAKKISLNIKFPKGKTETQTIGSAARSWRELTNKDVDVLLEEIRLSEEKEVVVEEVLSTDEVTEVIEKDIEAFIEKTPTLIGKSLKLKRRQFDTPAGRIDLLFEDKKGDLVVVELKLNKIGRDAVNQLRRYMKWLKTETKKEITGVIVCKSVMPAFEEDLRKLKDIKIFCYGWQLKVYPWERVG